MKRAGPLFKRTWIPFTQGCFVSSFAEIDPLVLETKLKMWKVSRHMDGRSSICSVSFLHLYQITDEIFLKSRPINDANDASITKNIIKSSTVHPLPSMCWSQKHQATPTPGDKSRTPGYWCILPRVHLDSILVTFWLRIIFLTNFIFKKKSTFKTQT